MSMETLKDDPDTQFYDGYTVEGLPCELVAFFDPAAPQGALPSYIGGTFSSRDGGGSFDIERLPDGTYRNAASGRIAKRPEDVMPWVVSKGTW